MYLAYRYVGLAVLLAEANFNAERLNLPIQRPIQESQVTFKFLFSPRFVHGGRFGGRIDAGGYSFGEGGSDQIRHVVKLDPFGGASAAGPNPTLSRQGSLITTNAAYLLAARWLKAIDAIRP